MSDNDIEDCHRVGKRGQTIVKFCKTKASKQVLNVRKDFTKLSMDNLQLTGQGKLYINQSLCSYYRVLWSKSKYLHRMSKIFLYYVPNHTVQIKMQEIMHTNDLEKLSVCWPESNNIIGGLFSIAISSRRFRISAASGMDFL